MIVGIITIFTILFFGGAQEYFFIEDLEKGVKTHIVDKTRKKEILTNLNAAKKTIDNFNKNRKKQVKELHNLNTTFESTTADFEAFYQQLAEERVVFQNKMLDQRMELTSSVEDSEWTNMISLSNETTTKRLIKEGKKKQVNAFENLNQKAEKIFADTDKMDFAQKEIATLKGSYDELMEQYASYNSLQSELLKNKNTTREQFMEKTESVNEMRMTALSAVKNFHFNMKENCNREQWLAMMKEVNKILD